MGRIAKEVVGQVISFSGFVLVCLTCGIPMWRVTTFVGPNITTGQIIWDGLWMNCVMQSTGQMQCSIHQFLMRLSRDLQAARALIVGSLVIAFIGVFVTFIGAKCTSCLSNPSSRAKVVILGGVLCIVAGVICLIPVCWSAAFTVADFLNPVTVETQRREIGASIYIGWVASLLLIIGGSILCSSCPPSRDKAYRYYQTPYTFPGTYAPRPYPYRGGSVVTPTSYVPPKYIPASYTPTVRGQYR